MLGSLQFVELERFSIYTFVPEPFTRYRTELNKQCGSLFEFVAAMPKG